MTLRRDGRPGTQGPDVLAERMTGVATIGHDPGRSLWQTIDQGAGHRQFVRLTRRQAEGDGTAAAVSDYAGLGAIATT